MEYLLTNLIKYISNLISNCINLQIVLKRISLSAYRSYKSL